MFSETIIKSYWIHFQTHFLFPFHFENNNPTISYKSNKFSLYKVEKKIKPSVATWIQYNTRLCFLIANILRHTYIFAIGFSDLNSDPFCLQCVRHVHLTHLRRKKGAIVNSINIAFNNLRLIYQINFPWNYDELQGKREKEGEWVEYMENAIIMYWLKT